MPSNRSVLLNVQLPDDLARRALSEGVDSRQAWLTVATDLNLGGHYEKIFLVVLPDRLATVGEPTNGEPVVTVCLQRERIQSIRTRHGVGGGFLEAMIDDIYVELLAYSNLHAEVFHKAAAKLEAWLGGELPEITDEDDHDPRKCPECGMALEFKGDICRRCMKRGAVFARVLKLMRPYRGRAILMMTLVLAGIALSLVPQLLIRFMIDRVLVPKQGYAPLPPQQATAWLMWLVLGLLGLRVTMTLLQILRSRLASFVGTQISYDMRSRVFRHLTTLSVGYYDRYNVGQLMSRVVGDTGQMRGFVQQLTGGFIAHLITIMAVGVVMLSLNWKLALITLIPAPLVVLSAVFFWKRIYPRYFRVWDGRSKLHGVLNTILSGIRVVKAFGQEASEEERFGRSSQYVRDSMRGVEYTGAIFHPSVALLFQLGGIMVWFIGGQWVLDGQGQVGAMSLGDLIAFLGYLGMLFHPLQQLTQVTNWLTQFLTATQRTFEILDTHPQITEAADAQALPDAGGGIRFENVTFGYNRHEQIIKGVSFDIHPGEYIGIVGKSGSGKTTLVNLLARFYDPDGGGVLINGVDTRDLKLDELRDYVGVVLQEPFLFRGTIYQNIAYGRGEATPEDVLTAAKAANAHDFIIRQPLGYDTYVGERGAGLSGGEKQRVSIARALLYDPKILIFDEATSNVDTESEQLIQKALAAVTKGRTTIAIAHRLSTLRNSDRILVVDDGRLIEQGTHEELLELGGLYYRLVKIQTELSREPNVDLLANHKD